MSARLRRPACRCRGCPRSVAPAVQAPRRPDSAGVLGPDGHGPPCGLAAGHLGGHRLVSAPAIAQLTALAIPPAVQATRGADPARGERADADRAPVRTARLRHRRGRPHTSSTFRLRRRRWCRARRADEPSGPREGPGRRALRNPFSIARWCPLFSTRPPVAALRARGRTAAPAVSRSDYAGSGRPSTAPSSLRPRTPSLVVARRR